MLAKRYGEQHSGADERDPNWSARKRCESCEQDRCEGQHANQSPNRELLLPQGHSYAHACTQDIHYLPPKKKSGRVGRLSHYSPGEGWVIR